MYTLSIAKAQFYNVKAKVSRLFAGSSWQLELFISFIDLQLLTTSSKRKHDSTLPTTSRHANEQDGSICQIDPAKTIVKIS